MTKELLKRVVSNKELDCTRSSCNDQLDSDIYNDNLLPNKKRIQAWRGLRVLQKEDEIDTRCKDG